MRRKSISLSLLLLVIFILGAFAVANIVEWRAGSIDVLLLVVLASLCALPFFFGLTKNSLQVFEPVYVYSFCTFSYFVVVPVALLIGGDFYFGGVDYRSELVRVLGLTILSLASFYIGYYWKKNRHTDRLTIYAPMDDDTKKFIHNWSFILLAFFSLLVALWIVTARIPLSTLWIFGEASYGDAWRAAQGVQVGYLYGARDAIPACLLLIIASRKKAMWGTLSTALLVVYTILLAGPGGRYYVLIPTMGAIALYYLERRKSPTVLQLSLLMFVLFYFLVGGLGYFRNPGNEIGEVEYTVSDAWDTTLEGTNLVVSTAASVKIVPRYENYLMGSSYLQLLIQPIPRFLWPDKPSWFGPRLLKEYWQYGAAAPFWVSFYLNFGLVGVLVGCILLGMFFRKIYNSYLYNPGNPLWIVLLSVFIPFMIHGYGRGSNEPGFVIYGAIYVMLPIILMTVLLRWRSRYHKIEVEYIPTGYEAGT